MTTNATKSKREVLAPQGLGATLPFDSIYQPGAYVCRWSGHLLRVNEDCMGPGGRPRVSMIGQELLMVTKIDDDPHVPIRTARLRAANANVPVRF